MGGRVGPERDGCWRASSTARTASSGSGAPISARPSASRCRSTRCRTVADGAAQRGAPRDAATAATATAAAGAGARRAAGARAHARARATPPAPHPPLTTAEKMAVLHAITQLHGKATTQKKVRRAAESALGQRASDPSTTRRPRSRTSAARRSRA